MRRILGYVMLVFVTLLAGSSFADKDAYDIASVKALDHELWEAWRNNDLTTINRLCAADYVSDDGETAVNLAEVQRYLAGTRIREYKQSEMKALRVSRDVVILSYTVEVSGTEFGNELPHNLAVANVWVRRGGKWLSVFVHEVPVQKP